MKYGFEYESSEKMAWVRNELDSQSTITTNRSRIPIFFRAGGVGVFGGIPGC